MLSTISLTVDLFYFAFYFVRHCPTAILLRRRAGAICPGGVCVCYAGDVPPERLYHISTTGTGKAD
jgi:hypothetical protein